MLRVKIEIDQRKLRQLADVAGSGGKLKQNIATAINKTQTRGVSIAAKKITEELAAPQKVVKEQLRKGDKANKRKLQTSIRIVANVKGSRSGRLALNKFSTKPKQNKAGVRYRVSKTKGSKVIPGAFQGPTPDVRKASWKNNVFRRVGKQRLPIVKLFGPSPWGVYVKNNYGRKTRKEIRKELRKQINERLRYLRLKNQGVI